ncbi:MAG: biotin/lipoyl-containing protein [Gammaproteobacteria bacterium]
MDGNLVDLLVEPGQSVQKGTTLAVLEAMKMEHPLRADMDGIVDSIQVGKGDQLKIRQLILTLKPAS